MDKNAKITYLLTEEQKVTARLLAAEYSASKLNSLSAKLKTILDSDNETKEKNKAVMELLSATSYSSFQWGLLEAVKDPEKFGLRPPKKVKRDYLALFGNLSTEVIQYLNTKAGTLFRTNTQAYIDLIGDRALEGYTLAEMKYVIDRQVAVWLEDASMCQHLNPDTLFNKTKFEKYLHGTSIIGTQPAHEDSQSIHGAQQTGNPNNAGPKPSAGKARAGTRKATDNKGFQHLKRNATTNIPK